MGAALSKERPQAFEGDKGLGIAFGDPRHYGWQPGHDGATESSFAELNAPGGNADASVDFLRQVTSNAIMSSREVQEAADRANLNLRGRGGGLNRTLSTVAGLIRADLATRIYYVSAGGFDTHANQAGQHDTLLGGIAEELEDFQVALRADGTDGRVMTMVFSEFGRRVAENNSGGTDHGTAAPMFLMGERVRPGLYGEAPNLLDLDGGDLKHSTDFRRVYATVLKSWFKVDSRPVLRGAFSPLDAVT